jgi:hypothetical protein
MAVIYIGGGSETEMHENRDKIIDSLNAAKTSLTEVIFLIYLNIRVFFQEEVQLWFMLVKF